MAASIWIQASAVKKCEHCKGKAGPFGIAGEYIRGKWRRLFGFCATCIGTDNSCADAPKSAAHYNLPASVFTMNPLPEVRIRQGQGCDEARALKAALEKALAEG